MRSVSPLLRSLSLLLSLFFLQVATAAPIVAPGQTHVFASPDGGERECRIEFTNSNCNLPRWRFGVAGTATGTDIGLHEARAIFDPPANVGIGNANHAMATLFNDFTISGSAGVVPGHVSVTFDYDASLLGALAYTVEAGLDLVLSDITNGTPGVVMASRNLVARDRSGDQGFTDLSFGSQRLNLIGQGGGFTVLLRRGHTYRIGFQASVVGVALLVAAPAADAFASWSDLRVNLAEDEVELLLEHDAAIKAGIAQHDADIKEMLENIQAGQQEIIRLLLTPQGDRESDFLICDKPGCGRFPTRPGRP